VRAGGEKSRPTDQNDANADIIVIKLIESLQNPKIRLSPSLWKFAKASEMYGPPSSVNRDEDDGPIESLEIWNLVKIPSMIKNPRLHSLEIIFAYERIRVETPMLGRRVAKMSEQTIHDVNQHRSVPLHVIKLHAALREGYGSLLTLAMPFNAMLRALNPCDILLAKESEIFLEEIITLAEYESQNRPIGASYIPLCLVAAWAAVNDALMLAKIEKIIDEYQSDFPQHRWMEMAHALRKKIESLHYSSSTHQLEQSFDSYCDMPGTTGLHSENSTAAGECCSIM
jgi:hypothetical protein